VAVAVLTLMTSILTLMTSNCLPHQVGGKGWQWPSSGPESIDIIMHLMTSNCPPHQVGGKGWQWPSSL
jgi:hypothetical protein